MIVLYVSGGGDGDTDVVPVLRFEDFLTSFLEDFLFLSDLSGDFDLSGLSLEVLSTFFFFFLGGLLDLDRDGVKERFPLPLLPPRGLLPPLGDLILTFLLICSAIVTEVDGFFLAGPNFFLISVFLFRFLDLDRDFRPDLDLLLDLDLELLDELLEELEE